MPRHVPRPEPKPPFLIGRSSFGFPHFALGSFSAPESVVKAGTVAGFDSARKYTHIHSHLPTGKGGMSVYGGIWIRNIFFLPNIEWEGSVSVLHARIRIQ